MLHLRRICDLIIKRILCALLACALFVIALPLTSCSRERRQQITYTDYFDTVTVFTAYTDKESFSIMCGELTSQLRDYHRLLDVYNTYPDVVNLKTLNDSNGKKMTVDSRLFDFLVWAKEAHQLTNGHTSIALGALTSLWHNSREMDSPIPPDYDKLKSAADHTDIDSLILDRTDKSVCLSDPELRLDAGALAKGYVADIVCQIIAEAGFTDFLLNLGGNVKAVGKKTNEENWRVGIDDPFNLRNSICTVDLKNASLVTSGSYQRYFDYNGTRYHHIINKDTLYPQNTFVSVSVLCSSSAISDALSTALFNLSFVEGLSLLDALDDVEVLWIFSDKAEPIRYTEGFEKYFKDTDK